VTMTSAPSFRDALQLRGHLIGEWLTTEARFLV
jgi:hypothetical protein